ncbi:MAG TPA: hypothetical protein VFW82_14135 [Dyella sp.]|nr:hypothetical protein [Dyella sp.]
MAYIELALLACGLVMLVLGYRRNRRGWLATAAVALFLAGAIGPMTTGFMQGLAEGWQTAGSSATH